MDHSWKPNGRPQSTLAQNFSAALDDLFQINGGLDALSKNVHRRKQTVTIQTSELEQLEARLRETEERLKLVKSSPTSLTRKDSQRRTPVEGSFSEEDKSRINNTRLVHRPRQDADKPTTEGARSHTPSSYNSAEYVVVDRPSTAREEDEKQA
ncbi:hypothetical protein GQ43DRAFT_111086 [Delitschia confertaspora ATCC 74209]|uniref:Uncharacterized protein n=1 Tax=Delitschia confertaspora ATCC 74209 TaxID=1513339 RepID=A0A9P4MNL2_9PLEO|nr:hypothetical protein GQ43DRAFT_111086 [Delitschia confertaspora ATCC 74209]